MLAQGNIVNQWIYAIELEHSSELATGWPLLPRSFEIEFYDTPQLAGVLHSATRQLSTAHSSTPS